MKSQQFKVGDKVKVTNKISDYYNLKATVKEVLFKDAGMIEFTKVELHKSKRAEQVLRARPTVYFYWRELARVK